MNEINIVEGDVIHFQNWYWNASSSYVDFALHHNARSTRAKLASIVITEHDHIYIYIYRRRYSFSFWLFNRVLHTKTFFTFTSFETDRENFRNTKRIPLYRWIFFWLVRATSIKLNLHKAQTTEIWRVRCALNDGIRVVQQLPWNDRERARSHKIYLLIYEICIATLWLAIKICMDTIYLTSCGENSFIFRIILRARK